MANSTPHKAQPAASKLSFLDKMDESKIVDWLSAYGKNLVYLLIALLVLIAVTYIISASFTAKPEKEYLQAASDFAYFTNGNELQDSALTADAYNRLQAIMSKYPELHAAYDGMLAQTFLNRNNVADAKPYAQATLARTKSNDLPYYADYASATLLISEQKFQAALEKAKSLQTKMIEAIAAQKTADKRSFGDELFALNLMRIAMLQQQTGDKAGELATWQEWKQYAGLATNKNQNVKVDPIAFRAVIQQLAVGAISLPDYIAFREKALTK